MDVRWAAVKTSYIPNPANLLKGYSHYRGASLRLALHENRFANDYNKQMYPKTEIQFACF